MSSSCCSQMCQIASGILPKKQEQPSRKTMTTQPSFGIKENDTVTRKSSHRRLSTACLPQYTCFVVPIDEILKMKSVKSHQELVSCNPPIVRPFNAATDRHLIFVSHQWSSMSHPDPEFKQFSVLQDVLKQLKKGAVVRSRARDVAANGRVESRDDMAQFLQNAVIWYDFFSVPQVSGATPTKTKNTQVQDSSKRYSVEDTSKCVLSIPAYIEMASMFLILCPVIPHATQLCYDGINKSHLSYSTWESRGWCRYYLRSFYDFYFRPVSEGSFACCESNHSILGETVACDKVIVAQYLKDLIEKRLTHLLQDKRMKEYHFLRVTYPFALRGLVDDIHFNLPAFDDDDLPFPPLFYKVMAGDLDGIKKLVESNADVNAIAEEPIDGGLIELSAERMNVFSSAMAFCRTDNYADILKYLYEQGANPHQPVLCNGGSNIHSFNFALTLADNPVTGQWLLQNVKDFDIQNGIEGQFFAPLFAACNDPTGKTAELILRMGANPDRTIPFGANFLGPCFFVAMPVPVIKKLLDLAGKDDDFLRSFRPEVKSEKAQKTLERWRKEWKTGPGKKHPLIRVMRNMVASTFIHQAVCRGQIDHVRWLAHEIKVSLDVKNDLGWTALEVARFFGYDAIVKVLEMEHKAQGVPMSSRHKICSSLSA